MNNHSHRQNQVLTILTIATATIGFGLFGTDFQTKKILARKMESLNTSGQT